MALVRINVPQQFHILVAGQLVTISAGISHVEEELTKHWYFKANGGEVLGPISDSPVIDEICAEIAAKAEEPAPEPTPTKAPTKPKTAQASKETKQPWQK